MAQVLFVSDDRPPSVPYSSQRVRKYDHLEEPIRALAPDEALLVALEPSTDGHEDLSVLARLKARLTTRFPRMGVTFIIDPDMHGVWVYRPAYRGPGGGRAIGPAKEDEVRARPLARAEPDNFMELSALERGTSSTALPSSD
jgi:hypothetical protein